MGQVRVQLGGNCCDMAWLGVFFLLAWLSFLGESQAAPILVLCEGTCTLPVSVAVDPVSGHVFVADSFNNRVLVYPPLEEIAGPSQQPIAYLGQTSSTGIQANLGHPTSPTANSLYYPAGVFVDQARRLWVADDVNSRVLWWDNAANRTTGSNADGVLGQSNFTAFGYGSGLQNMNAPLALSVDSLGTLWVCDSSNFRVLYFHNAASKIAGSPADGAILSSPIANLAGVWGAPNGDIFVVENTNNRVLRYPVAQAKSGGIPDIAFLQPNLSSTVSNFPSPPAYTTATNGGDPQGVTGNPTNGDLFVSDAHNNRVLMYRAGAYANASGTAATAFLGQNGPAGNSSGGQTDQMSFPHRIFYDTRLQTLWVADSDNNRVLCFNVSSSAPLSSIDSNTLELVLAFADGTPPCHMLPKDSNGVTHEGLYEVFVQPSALVETDSANDVVASWPFPATDFAVATDRSNLNLQMFNFSTVSQNTTVNILYTLYGLPTVLSNAGVGFNISGSTAKLTLSIIDWPFHSSATAFTLQVALITSPPVISIIRTPGNGVTSFTLQHPPLTTTIQMLDYAVVDGVNTPISSDIRGTATLIMRFPVFNHSLQYDPSFSVVFSGGEGSSGGDNLQLLALLSLLILPILMVLAVVAAALVVWTRRFFGSHSKPAGCVNYRPEL